MDLKAIAQAAVTMGFNAAGTIRTAGNVQSRAADVYDPVTRLPTFDSSSSPIPVNAIMGQFSSKDIDGDTILQQDRMILINVADLTGIPLDSNCFFTETASGKKWEFREAILDPSGSIYRCHGRLF